MYYQCTANREFYVLSSERLDFKPGPSNETDLAEDRYSLNGYAQRFLANFVRPPVLCELKKNFSAPHVWQMERKRQQTALRALAAAFLLRHANVGNGDDNNSILKNVANGAV
jgi:hypothetical protein